MDGKLYTRFTSLDWDNNIKIKKAITIDRDDKNKVEDF